MSYQKHYAPDRVEEAGRDAVKGDRGALSREEGAMARASALLAPIRLDGNDKRKAALTVARVQSLSGDLRAAQVAEVRRLLDILGLLPEPAPVPSPAPEAATAPPSAERQPGKAARVAEFGRLTREKHLTEEEAAAEMGVRPSTAAEYARILRAEDQREQYFEARHAGFTSHEAVKYAGIHGSQRKAHEKAWRDHQAAGGRP